MKDTAHPGDYERSDADPRLIGGLALGIALFLLVTPWLLAAIYPGARHTPGIPGDLPQPPQPRLQTDPKADLLRLRGEERARLDSYGWADREHQTAHIPIDRAIELLARRGLPGWPSSNLPPR